MDNQRRSSPPRNAGTAYNDPTHAGLLHVREMLFHQISPIAVNMSLQGILDQLLVRLGEGATFLALQRDDSLKPILDRMGAIYSALAPDHDKAIWLLLDLLRITLRRGLGNADLRRGLNAFRARARANASTAAAVAK